MAIFKNRIWFGFALIPAVVLSYWGIKLISTILSTIMFWGAAVLLGIMAITTLTRLWNNQDNTQLFSSMNNDWNDDSCSAYSFNPSHHLFENTCNDDAREYSVYANALYEASLASPSSSNDMFDDFASEFSHWLGIK